MSPELGHRPRKAPALPPRTSKGRPPQGGCHAVVAWRPTCRAGGGGTIWTRHGPSSKAQGKVWGRPTNRTRRPSASPSRNRRPPQTREPSDLTNATLQPIMPTSAQRPIRLADHSSCPIPAEPTQLSSVNSSLAPCAGGSSRYPGKLASTSLALSHCFCQLSFWRLGRYGGGCWGQRRRSKLNRNRQMRYNTPSVATARFVAGTSRSVWN